MVNKVIIVGRLGKDPELRQAGASPVCNFSVATSEKWKGKDGQAQTRTEWHRIVVWGKLADLCKQFLSKGKQVYLEGKLQTRSWQDQAGATKYATEIVADTVKFLGERDAQAAPEPQAGEVHESKSLVFEPSMDDCDIPF